ncbi:MAG: hypothetical protein D3913_01655 [Candidatus Electrothrix sp. LOE1_4_5]|nr:hypothetical protein [Candidatus Electrothrix gigas]
MNSMKLEVEIFRILSAFGIVWFHSGMETGRSIAYGGLIFFSIVTTYFATISTRTHSFFNRLERVVIPFFLWGIFYGVINLLFKGSVFPEHYMLLSKILASPSIHLWFLPFIFLSHVIVDNFKQVMSREWFATMIGVTVIILISTAPIWRGFDYYRPLGQYAHVLPAVLIGIFFGGIRNIRDNIRVIVNIGIFISIMVMTIMHQSGVGITYLVGMIPCIFLFVGHTINNNDSFLFKISSATFGVYLLHPFALKVLRYLEFDGWLLPFLAFFSSLIIVMSLKTVAPKKYIKYLV